MVLLSSISVLNHARFIAVLHMSPSTCLLQHTDCSLKSVYTLQPVAQPASRMSTVYSQLYNWLYNQLDETFFNIHIINK